MPGGRDNQRGRIVLPGAKQVYPGRQVLAQPGVVVDPYHPLYYANTYDLRASFYPNLGAQLGATLRVTAGSSVPTLTISGTPTAVVSLAVECTSVAGGTALGQAEVRWSFDDSVTFSASTVTAASISIGNGLTLECGAGTYATNQRWSATVAQWDDQSGNANHAEQATASRQPIYRVAAFGGYHALDYLTGTTFGLATPAISLGRYTYVGSLRGDASSSWVLTHMSVANAQGNEVFARTSAAISHVPAAGVGSKSAKNTSSATWLADGTRRTWAVSFNGTHQGHKAFRNGVRDASTTFSTFSHNPGTAQQSGPIYIGNSQAFNGSMRGLMHELHIFGEELPEQVIYNLHLGIVARAAGAI